MELDLVVSSDGSELRITQHLREFDLVVTLIGSEVDIKAEICR